MLFAFCHNTLKEMFYSDETILEKNLLEALEDLRRRERERDFKRLSAVIAMKSSRTKSCSRLLNTKVEYTSFQTFIHKTLTIMYLPSFV